MSQAPGTQPVAKSPSVHQLQGLQLTVQGRSLKWTNQDYSDSDHDTPLSPVSPHVRARDSTPTEESDSDAEVYTGIPTPLTTPRQSRSRFTRQSEAGIIPDPRPIPLLTARPSTATSRMRRMTGNVTRRYSARDLD